MSTDTPKKLLQEWHVKTLTQKRAIGQLLQHIVKLHDEQKIGQTRRSEIQRAVEANTINLKNEVKTLQAQIQQVNTRLDRLEDHLGLPRRGRPPKDAGKPKK
ncbi:hypothetical protein QUF58_08910 [Anaerolineales bacterium HSG24]|nr:hypothetical protein [Anaerolineales bacterium HSG24]